MRWAYDAQVLRELDGSHSRPSEIKAGVQNLQVGD